MKKPIKNIAQINQAKALNVQKMQSLLGGRVRKQGGEQQD